jgi:tripartite-type tricarboxylate transporter receptor subunit TctC
MSRKSGNRFYDKGHAHRLPSRPASGRGIKGGGSHKSGTLSRRSVLGGLAGIITSPRLAVAGAYPERAITLIVPFAPGGSTDILARIVSDHLARALKQPIVVENRTGASGNIGTAAVARAAPDGYTFLFNTMSVHTMNHALFAAMPFDGVRDFSAITLLAYVTNTMAVHPSIPATSVREFVDYARANPGRIAYASAGAGSTNHLCGALFEKMAQVAMVHVPYRGGAPAVTDTVAGQTQLIFAAGTQSLEHVKAGRLRLLAVTEPKRSSLLPETPTVAETLPGYEMSVWYAAYGPAGMPGEIVARLNAEIARILYLPDVRQRMADIAVETAASSPEDLGHDAGRCRQMGQHHQAARHSAGLITKNRDACRGGFQTRPLTAEAGRGILLITRAE